MGGKRTFARYDGAMRLSAFIVGVVPFLWRFTRVRNVAAKGKFCAARHKLATLQAPEDYLCLKEAYDAWLASMAYAAKVTLEPLEDNQANESELVRLMFELQSHRCYSAGRTPNERYTARYIDYLETLVLGDTDKRRELAQELRGIPADSFFKTVLPVT
jgi:hypothetical protein